jgi:hypothetical protein
MFDRYDPRDDGRDRGDSWDCASGSRGGAAERDRGERCNRIYEVDGDESRTLATIARSASLPKANFTISATTRRARCGRRSLPSTAGCRCPDQSRNHGCQCRVSVVRVSLFEATARLRIIEASSTKRNQILRAIWPLWFEKI